MDQQHRLDVAFRTDRPLRVITPDDWAFEWDDEGHVAGAGPCPSCFGDAHGPPLLEADDVEAQSEAEGDDRHAGRSFVATCSCGGPHGAAEHPTCGSKFVVNAPERRRR